MEGQLRNLIDEQKEEDYGASLREAWENGMGLYDEANTYEGMKFNSEGVPVLDTYTFGMVTLFLDNIAISNLAVL